MTSTEQAEPTDCKWHEGDERLPENYEYDQGCPDCGRAYDTRRCPVCGGLFLDWWSPAPAFHDVFTYPRVTSHGDMTCSRCLPQFEREEEEFDDDFCMGEPDYEL